jgi:hypothetical protein
MADSRWTVGLAVCGLLGACSTESSTQPIANAGVTGGDTGAQTAGVGAAGVGTAGVGGGEAGTSVVTAGVSGAAGSSVGEAGSGAAGTSEAMVDGGVDASMADAAQPMTCEPGPTTGSSVLLIGDSYMDINTKAFGTELQKLAKAAGALASGEKYTDRSVSGSQMVGGLIGPNIPTQYANENNSDGHIKTVVMDGGGNDVLLGDRNCITVQAPPESQHCVDTIAGTVAAAKTLFAKMAADGVENVVYFFYPHLPGGGLGGTKSLEDATLDYSLPITRESCEGAPVHCVFVDTVGLFGETAGDFQDGIHPTVANINKISAAVWDAMVTECVAQ